MKKCLVTIFLLCLIFSSVGAQQYKPNDDNSAVKFKVSHQMIFKSTVTGSFRGLKGTIVFDPKNLAGSSFDVSVNAATVSTGIGLRDNDLKKEKYFDVQKFPKITIMSKAINKGRHENEFILSAYLTMKGKIMLISFPFTAVPGNEGYLLKGNFHINRLDFNVGPDNSIDKSVEISLTVAAERAPQK